MDLQRRRDIDMLGQRFGGDGIGQHIAQHGVARHSMGSAHASQRLARRRWLLDIGGGVEQRSERHLEGGIGDETGPIERRHGMGAGARQRFAVGHVRFGQAVLDAVLDFSEIGEETQIGTDLAAGGQSPQA